MADLRREQRSIELTKVEAACIYEALVLLSMMAAQAKRPEKLPYDPEFADVLRERVIDDAWPELAATYRGVTS